MIVLDSDHCIELLRGRLDVRDWAAADELLAVTTITVGELVHGARRSAQPERNLARVEVLLAAVEVLPFGEAAARRFGLLKADLERSGQRLADLDLQIAATCIASGATLATHNLRHFGRIEGLAVIDWLA
ncbi:MAG: PIN domain-containing protein [Caldilineaceae bacterium]